MKCSELDLLDKIEEQEIKSLQWGYVDGFVQEEEAIKTAQDLGANDAFEWISNLKSKNLIIEVEYGGGLYGYRSRFAEFVRLLSKNRQLFPNKSWQTSPLLVSDFRVDRRKRLFPQRNITPKKITESFPSLINNKFRSDTWDALTKNVKGFASFQERAISRLIEDRKDSGTIITAGTGSGKTIAFYIPALIRICEKKTRDSWVKCISIYPRNELLKDQFTEVFRLSRLLDDVLVNKKKPKVKLGTFFGLTPYDGSQNNVGKIWHRNNLGFICPWIRCYKCEGEMIWKYGDLGTTKKNEVERLFCSSNECDGLVREGEISLTRQSVRNNPPDILFTTTESLNKRIADSWNRELFLGKEENKRPFLALLDEVHTYEGTSGAHVALLLRRWSFLLGEGAKNVHWTGLSATLPDAQSFFSDLTNKRQDNIEEITPSREEYMEDSAEYQIIIRGNPASKTSLLSTTIQTAMLVPRILESPTSLRDESIFGCRAFAFTDQLDSVHRLYWNLMDAEAYTRNATPSRSRHPLAYLRSSDSGVHDAVDKIRDSFGQIWKLAEKIGHDLRERLVIGLTTSMNSGVIKNSNMIVATSALEVGYNDPSVGAVIQHKSPVSMASYIQRKGRAGRIKSMRPITITVLSDFGRDRYSYQNYEYLFDTQLTPQTIPISNPYILKIQSLFAFFDWLAKSTLSYKKGSFHFLLSGPQRKERDEILNAVKEKLVAVVRGDDKTLKSLKDHLQNALQIDEEDIKKLLWNPPRALLTEAIPTLVRRVFTDWELAFPKGTQLQDLLKNDNPLPDFLPDALFGELGLPEVNLIIPEVQNEDGKNVHSLPILQSLKQFVPGKVSARYGNKKGQTVHWFPINVSSDPQTIIVSDYADKFEYLGKFTPSINQNIEGKQLDVYRPWQISLCEVDLEKVLPSSNSFFNWLTEIKEQGDPIKVGIPKRNVWRRYINDMSFFLHKYGSKVSVRRFASSANASLKTKKTEYNKQISFKNSEGADAAVGFELLVDGLKIEFDLSDVSNDIVSTLPKLQINELKSSYIRDRLRYDKSIEGDEKNQNIKNINYFQRDWLFQFLLSGLIEYAETNKKSFEASINECLSEESISDFFKDTISAVLSSNTEEVELDDGSIFLEGADYEEIESINKEDNFTKLTESLLEIVSVSSVRNYLSKLAKEFVKPDGKKFNQWLKNLVMNTLAESVLQACNASSPNHVVSENLMVDLNENIESHSVEIWITESTLGGAGVLESFASKFSEEPHLFFSAIEAALVPSDLELVDQFLKKINRLVTSDQSGADQIERLRSKSLHAEKQIEWDNFSKFLLDKSGISPNNSLSIAINQRFLRPGSDKELDEILNSLLKYWEELQEKYELSIDLREFSFVAGKEDSICQLIKEYLEKNIRGYEISEAIIRSSIENFLWPSSIEIRQNSLQSENTFRKKSICDPIVIRSLFLKRETQTIQFGDKGWEEKFKDELSKSGIVSVCAKDVDISFFKDAVLDSLGMPVPVGSLSLFPIVDEIHKEKETVIVTFILREII